MVADVLRRLHLDVATSTALHHLISALSRTQHEQRPICASILLVPRNGPLDDPGVYLRAGAGVTVRDTGLIESLALLINGFEGAVVLTADGAVLGNCVFPEIRETRDPFLPRRYVRAAAMSRKTGGLLFLQRVGWRYG